MKNEFKIYFNTLFTAWLKQNINRLSVQILCFSNNKDIIYYFDGIPKDLISVEVNESGIIVWAWYDYLNVDMLRDIDVHVEYSKGMGYHCGICIKPKYYITLEDLFIQHVFEELLEWINTKLIKSKYIYVCFLRNKDDHSTSWAYLDVDIKIRHRLKRLISYFKKDNKNKSDEAKIQIRLWRRK